MWSSTEVSQQCRLQQLIGLRRHRALPRALPRALRWRCMSRHLLTRALTAASRSTAGKERDSGNTWRPSGKAGGGQCLQVQEELFHLSSLLFLPGPGLLCGDEMGVHQLG